MRNQKIFFDSCFGFIFTILFILSGCAATKPGLEAANPMDLTSILSTLKMRYDLVDSFTTWLNAGIELHGRKEEIRASLYYEKPDKLRVDARGPFNEPKAVMLAVGKSFKIYFVAENELITGDLSDEVIKDIFDVDIRVSDIYSSVFANPFLDGNTTKLQMDRYKAGYLVRRPSTRADYREEISIEARDDVFVSKWQVLDTKGNLTQEITFSKYQEVGGILRPLKAVIRRPGDETIISIESFKPEINVEFPERTFDLPTPDGAKVYKLSDLKNR